jgi:nicotinate-nucleotide adenylyltransferase
MIGILGGTFDPVHFGHLRPALEVKTALGLKEIRIIPCAMPPHRAPPVATHAQRAAMLYAALEGHDGFVVDEREFDRDGPSYTYETLLTLKADFPAATLCLLLGMDAFRGLASWHRWRELFNFCHMVVMTRPGSVPPDSGELGTLVARRRMLDPAGLRLQSSGMLYFQPVTQLEISGTQIRKLMQAGGDASFLVPDRVLDCARQAGIYYRAEQ